MEEIVFPNKIRLLRRQQNKKMQDIANHVGLSLSALSKIEKGFRRLSHQQSLKIADFLNCEIADLYLTENDKDSPIVSVWQDVVAERIKKNQNTGLKILASGLRFIRMEKNLTLNELAARAKITVSVYHRIEHGEREIYENELVAIAKVLGMAPHKLVEEIYNLYKGGVLENFQFKVKKNREKPAVSTDRESLLALSKSLYGDKLLKTSRTKMISLLGQVKKDEGVMINKKSDDLIEAPFPIVNENDFFAFYADSKTLKNVFPKHAVFFAQKVDHYDNGDIVLLCEKDFETSDKTLAKLMKIADDLDGKTYVVSTDLKEKVIFNKAILKKLFKICFIDMRR